MREAMFRSNNFTTKERHCVNLCLDALESLTYEDDYFVGVVEQFNSAARKEQETMARYLLSLYEEWQKRTDSVSLADVILLASYEWKGNAGQDERATRIQANP